MKILNKVGNLVQVKLESLSPLQGDLKFLSDENYEKLKKSMIDQGFSSPFFAWKKGRKFFLLDGHQRHTALTRMKEEGISIPEKLPVVEIKAKTEKEAKKKILSISSQYGTISDDGLSDFMNSIDLGLEEATSSFNFDAVDFGNFETVPEFKEKEKKKVEFSAKEKDESFLISVSFPNEKSMNAEYQRLTNKGYMVRIL